MREAPLKGIRAVEFGSAVAGPMATRMLGMLGVEVIKVESMSSPDQCRFFDILYQLNADGESSTMYNYVNMNKKNVTINIRDPKGAQLAKELMGTADVVLESMSPGVMTRLGLGYEEIKKIKHDIIYVSSSACGQTGPEGRYKGYAPNFAALAGVDHMTGYDDALPSSFAASIDVKSAMTCTFAILTALVHHKETGEGQFIDVSSTASISSLIGDVLLDSIITGENPMRKGNRSDAMAPHNCYRCSGEDKWVSIAVGNDQEWQSLCKAMQKDELTADPRFSDNWNRLKNQDELDRIIGEWTLSRENDQIMHMLQERGVAATVTSSSESLFNDPHINVLGLFEQIDHHTIGKTWVIRHPWKLSETPPEPNRAAPKLGEHNDDIFGQSLGLDQEKIAQLKEEKVLF